MRPGVRAILSAAACLAMAASLWSCGPQNCGCGASPDDALSEHDLSFSGDHALSDGCACRCGDGPVHPRPYDAEGTCDYERERCTDELGYDAALECSG